MSPDRINTEPNPGTQRVPETRSLLLHPNHAGLRALMASIYVEPLGDADRAVLTEQSPGFVDEYDQLHGQHLPPRHGLRVVDTD